MMFAAAVLAATAAGLRPPAVPLAVQDPYTSLWSPHDNLNDGWPMRWNGKEVQATGLVRVGRPGAAKCYTWMGVPPSGCEAAEQKSVAVNATSTTYVFGLGSEELQVIFLTPSGMYDKDYVRMSLPVTLVRFVVVGTQTVDVYMDMTGDLTAVDALQTMQWSRVTSSGSGIGHVQIGNLEQTFGCGAACIDNINWGFVSIGFANASKVNSTIGAAQADAHAAFAAGKPLPSDSKEHRTVRDDTPVVAVATRVMPGEEATLYFGYDDKVGAMDYFGTIMHAYWTHVFSSYLQMLEHVVRNTNQLWADSYTFDARLYRDLEPIGTSQYAELGGLAYRQVMGAMKFVWNPVLSKMWVFMKEISSDGDISTVDVIYPSAPMLLAYDAELVSMLLEPVMVYAANGTAPYGRFVDYNLAWVPHHLGVWPVADLPADKQENMPIEETANLLLLYAYVAERAGSVAFLKAHWALLSSWGEYLTTVLPDPGTQLCTDDFEGPSPHNVNLAVKGILGLGAWAKLLNLAGDTEKSAAYMSKATGFAKTWEKDAKDGSGTHTKLQYDLQGTWSQKYNLVWQPLLGLSLIPSSILDDEAKFYQEMMNAYGIPLDNRASFTKVDWSFWCGAFSDREQFLRITAVNYKWVNDSPVRVPWSDWIHTLDAGVQGFQARPVLGGIFARLLVADAARRRGEGLL